MKVRANKGGALRKIYIHDTSSTDQSITTSILLKLPSFISIDMRAFVFLCLLHAALGQGNGFSWNGPGQVDPNPDPIKDNACRLDQGSCGCCLMLQGVNRLRTYFNNSMSALEKEYLQSKQSLNIIEASRTAFSVALFSDDHFKCYGPFGVNSSVIYKHVFLNLGGGYSTETGIFTVPRSGVYSIAVSIYSDVGSPGNKLAVCAGLKVNDQVVAGSKDQNANDKEDSSTIAVVLHLKARDQVVVNLPSGCFICDDSHHNTFSAFLLYVTE